MSILQTCAVFIAPVLLLPILKPKSLEVNTVFLMLFNAERGKKVLIID